MVHSVKSVAGRRSPVAPSFDYVIARGYMWSGSSAVVDILREFSPCYFSGHEFDVISYPYGLGQLFHSVVTCQSGRDIGDFIDFTKFLYRSPTLFKMGSNYREVYGENFMRATEDFVSSLVEFEHGEMSFFKMGAVETFIKQAILRASVILKRRLHLMKRFIVLGKKAYFTDVDAQKFITAAKKYIDDIFAPIVPAGTKHVILDQAVSVGDYVNQMKFLRDSKMIVVDRDPRDSYADILNDGHPILREGILGQKHRVDVYLRLHNKSRRNQQQLKNDPNVLFLRFEDLIYHYDEALQRIIDFVGLDPADHIYKRKYFNPDISIKNIGMWKDILTDDEVNAITAELSDYFYTR